MLLSSVVNFVAYYGYNVDRWSFPPKKQPDEIYPKLSLLSLSNHVVDVNIHYRYHRGPMSYRPYNNGNDQLN